uniref:Uncharacterized protein n=1 Tax=Candidatus Methanogaster sp. ANME-2c ERB4 TaxID=2759911 RepID=A0A7G9YJY5_9EURY|nr:hypothetical protein KDGELCJN_00002 [Methanosarcinales archaeon ANME-2c ERB4]
MDSMMRVVDAVSPDIEFVPCEAGEGISDIIRAL